MCQTISLRFIDYLRLGSDNRHMLTHQSATTIGVAKAVCIFSMVVILAPILLTTGCNKHDQALAELTADLSQLKEQQERLKAELGQVSESHASLETELATHKEALKSAVVRSVQATIAADKAEAWIAELDFEALKQWRENGALEASLLTLSNSLSTPHKTYLGPAGIHFYEGEINRGTISGSVLKLSGDSSASIKVSSLSGANTVEVSITDTGAMVRLANDKNAVVSMAAPQAAFFGITRPNDEMAVALIDDGESATLELHHADSSIQLRADPKSAQIGMSHSAAVIDLIAEGNGAVSRFHVGGMDNLAALGIARANDVLESALYLESSHNNTKSQLFSNRFYFDKNDKT